MKWEQSIAGQLQSTGSISNLESKREVAERVAREVKNGDVIGFGSGSTSMLAVQAIAARMRKEQLSCVAIPTSTEIAFICADLGIPTATLIEARPDWGFDGADEVDLQCNLIKGRGGAMFREKLVIEASRRTFILIDPSKLVPALGRNFPVPIEVFPEAANLVSEALRRLGATEIALRLAVRKDGPVYTENRNLILDVRFREIAGDLEKRINEIPGVIACGLFQGRKFEVLVSGQAASR